MLCMLWLFCTSPVISWDEIVLERNDSMPIATQTWPCKACSCRDARQPKQMIKFQQCEVQNNTVIHFVLWRVVFFISIKTLIF